MMSLIPTGTVTYCLFLTLLFLRFNTILYPEATR